MRIIVCGGRDYANAVAVGAVLGALGDHVTIVHGDAPGADSLAGQYALRLGLAVEAWPANWGREGRAAGPKRNRRMLEAGASLVIAFPGGRGTHHMTTIAEDAGVPVLHVT